MTRETNEARKTKRRIKVWHGLLVLAIVGLAMMVTLRWRWRWRWRQRAAL